ncbi:COX15/CtaA family protein [Chitinilyticum piscinae]|uniref:COX15/CtaA family protein n=1 Tax=Chitinilyticum piscinae TaxID=2866724 RepID=A0A8J7K2H9_9NEIS|nr:COX15/CtaA family protein [Chitinilyticum piscinae]MBE9610496.1 COX15/CtaA family protein [Chitinilyticum piscinae]
MKRLLLSLIALCWLLIMLGAFVRLSDAGLGCPDWPTCYGHLYLPDEHHEIAAASQQFGQAVDPSRAFKEMLHRYVAGSLGLLLLVVVFGGWRTGWPRLPLLLPCIIVLGQALLGMWTVTEKLMPAVVTAHLLGGMLLLASLVWLGARSNTLPSSPSGSVSAGWLVAAVLLQIMLGGWVSSNYAGPACADFPLCQGELLHGNGLLQALDPARPLGLNSDGSIIRLEQLAAIHTLHRAGALLVLLCGLWQGLRLWQSRRQELALLLVALLAGQVLLGILNALWAQPLLLAVLHNGLAALLLALSVWLAARPAPIRENLHELAGPVIPAAPR